MIAFDHLYCYHYLCLHHINNHNHNITSATTLSTVLTQHQHNPSKQHLYINNHHRPRKHHLDLTNHHPPSHEHLDLDDGEGSASEGNVMGAPTDNYSKCAVVLFQRHLVIRYYCDNNDDDNNDDDSDDHLDYFRPSPGTWPCWGKAVLNF